MSMQAALAAGSTAVGAPGSGFVRFGPSNSESSVLYLFATKAWSAQDRSFFNVGLRWLLNSAFVACGERSRK
jgi:hypothetical protein